MAFPPWVAFLEDLAGMAKASTAVGTLSQHVMPQHTPSVLSSVFLAASTTGHSPDMLDVSSCRWHGRKVDAAVAHGWVNSIGRIVLLSLLHVGPVGPRDDLWLCA